MKNIWVVVVLSLVFFSFDLSKSATKKMNKTLAKIWPEQTIIKNPINIDQALQKKYSFKLESNTLYDVVINTKSEAYVFLSKGLGKMDVFDYMIVFNKDLSILKVKVLVYREDYGGEIGSNRWLKQFIGKKDPVKMKFGHDIQNISGATISSRSLTEDVKKVTRQMIALKQKGIL
ncbi:MAG: FMN-binding protein [Flavobacteriales bacterium]|nr:MAG: FMN-binding protein [Flavobacteriales bacterium]